MGFALALLALAVLILVARIFGRALSKWTEHLPAIETFLTIAALVLAARWYFFERPDVPKLRIEQSVQAIQVEPQRVLLLIDASVQNVGSSALDLAAYPYIVEVLQVTPMPRLVAGEYSKPKPNLPARISANEQWWTLAVIDGEKRPHKGEITIEAGETENFYFRVVLDCKPDLRLLVRSSFQKPPVWQDKLFRKSEPPVWWIKQTLVDASKECRKRS